MHTFKTIHTWSINQNFYGVVEILEHFYIHNLYHFQSAVHLWKGFKTMLWSVPSNIYLLTWQMLLFKETYCAFKVNIFSVDAFPGILAHDLGVASTMIYQFSGSRMYTKMPCVILIWIKHFFFNWTSSSGWLVLLLESTLRYCKLLHKEECLAKKYILSFSYIENIYGALHETLLRQKGAFSNNLIAAQSYKRDTGSPLVCQPSGCTVHPQLKRWTI